MEVSEGLQRCHSALDILVLYSRVQVLSLAFRVVSLKTQIFIDSLESLEIKGLGLFSLGDCH